VEDYIDDDNAEAFYFDMNKESDERKWSVAKGRCSTTPFWCCYDATSDTTF